MLDIQLGDRGPRVVLLQILLNRKGNALNVDGAYGPKTKTALEGFQRNATGHATGHCDPATFNLLFRDSGLCIIDSLDVGDEMVKRTAEPVLNDIGAGPPIELGLMCNGVGQLIQEVISRANCPIALLRLAGHGNFGRWMTVSVGAVAHLEGQAKQDAQSEYFSYLDLKHFTELRDLLSQLNNRFAKFWVDGAPWMFPWQGSGDT